MHGSRSRSYLWYVDDDDDDNDGGDDDNNDDKDDYSCNSANFKDRTSRFCMEVDLDHTFDMLMMIFNNKLLIMIRWFDLIGATFCEESDLCQGFERLL